MVLKDSVKEDWTVRGIADRLIELNQNKDNEYTTDVIDKLDAEVWLSQILIKAARAKYSKTEEKAVEEVMDMIVYGVLYIEKVKRGVS